MVEHQEQRASYKRNILICIDAARQELIEDVEQAISKDYIEWMKWGSQDGLNVHTLVLNQSSLGLNPELAINCHPGVSQAW